MAIWVQFSKFRISLGKMNDRLGAIAKFRKKNRIAAWVHAFRLDNWVIFVTNFNKITN